MNFGHAVIAIMALNAKKIKLKLLPENFENNLDEKSCNKVFLDLV
jgi:hypothetical protein